MRLTLAVLSTCAVISAAAAQSRMSPVTATTSPVDIGWATAAPPSGSDWYVLERNRANAVFGKKLESPRHTMMAAIISRSLPNCCANADELLALYRRGMVEDRRDSRYRWLSDDGAAVVWAGLACVEFRHIAEDRGVPFARGEVFNYLQRNLVCLHPTIHGSAIELNYSERGGPPHGTPQLVNEGEAFLRGLSVTNADDVYGVGLHAFDSGVMETARAAWSQGAERGDCDSQYRLGTLYLLGMGVPHDHAIARSWLEKSAQQGNWRAQGVLMTMYLHARLPFGTSERPFEVDCTNGCGVEKDPLTAYRWFLITVRLRQIEQNQLPKLSEFSDYLFRELTSDQRRAATNEADQWRASPQQCKPR